MTDVLHIQTLGTLRIRLNEDTVTGFVSRKVDALLVYLAANPREHPREMLGEMLWDDLSQKRTMANLRTALSSLQKQLSPFITATRQTISINTASDIRLDYAEIGSIIGESERYWATHHRFSSDIASQVEKAMLLYAGDFMERFHVRDASGFEGWMVIEQERLRSQYIDMLCRLSHYHTERNHLNAGLDVLSKLLAIDPIHEEAQRSMMTLLAQSGQRSAALALYENFKETLQTELHVEPDEETRSLFERIQSGAVLITGDAETPNNLPVLTTPFVDREVERAQIAERITNPDCRLLTLAGPGGIGKTRLALEIARQRMEDFPHGVYFITFADLTRASFVAQTIVNALGIEVAESVSTEDTLIKILQDRTMLLILDNFEHLIDDLDLIVRILENAPAVKLMVTSRERLGLMTEWLYTVEALDYPASLDDETAEASGAVQLFVNSAQRIQPDFDFASNREAVIRICQLVEGMPLAVELAASWTRMLSAPQIRDEIERGLDFLTTNWRSIPGRHRSIRAVFESSWNMLSDNERELFKRVSIFEGSFDYAAARAITGGSLFALSNLVDKSLVGSVDGRYALHTLLQKYAHDKLVEAAAEYQTMLNAHSHYYTHFLVDREPRLSNNASDSAVDEVLQETGNLRAVWERALAESDETTVSQFIKPLFRLYDLGSRYSEGAQVFETAAERVLAFSGDPHNITYLRLCLLRGVCLQQLQAIEAAQPLVELALPHFDTQIWYWERRIALAALGNLAYAHSNYQAARGYFENALAIARDHNEDSVIPVLLLRLSDLASVFGEHKQAEQILEEILSLTQETGGQQNEMRLLLNIGDVKTKLGYFEEAHHAFSRALRLSELLDASTSQAVALVSLGRVAIATGEYGRAIDLCRRSVARFEKVRNRWGKAFTLMHMGRAYFAQDELTEANHYYRESMTICDEIGIRSITSGLLRLRGLVHIKLGDYDTAEADLKESLVIALDMNAMPLIMDTLVGLAALAGHRSQTDRVLRLLSFVIQQPATEFETQRHAQALLDELALPVAEIDAAFAQALNVDLTTITGEILDSPIV